MSPEAMPPRYLSRDQVLPPGFTSSKSGVCSSSAAVHVDLDQGPQPPPLELAQVVGEAHGACCGHGRAASICADSRSRVTSSSVRPTSWTAVGRPSAASPHGTEAAGLPATFHSTA